MSGSAVRLCKRCQRANPREAAYCYHDGMVLDSHVRGDVPADGSAMNIGARPFTIPFVLASGRRCHNFFELAVACYEDPAAAFDLLRQGHLEAFLAGQGRSDLAQAARAAARATDESRGLDDFLGRLPAAALMPAKLRVEPKTYDLGTLRPGEDRRFELTLRNDGMRLLYGSAGCDVPWLSLGDKAALPSKVFEFTKQTVLPIHVLGRQLRARDKPQVAEVQIESNGGKAAITVRVYVPVKPFAEGVLSGALSPRQAAQKAMTAPKEAAALLENGALARWYESNGWTYPVLGPSASGVAAVQQFLEALGLAKPPHVEISEEKVKLRGKPGEKLEYPLSVVTHENRAAWAFATSDQPWLQMGKPVFRGRSAFLQLLVASVPGQPGDTLQAVLSVTANGNQRFKVPVTLTVAGAVQAPPPAPPRQPARTPAPPAMPPPVPVPAVMKPAPPPTPRAPAVAPPAAPVAGGHIGWPWWLTLIPLLLLVAAIGGAALRDYLAPVPPPKTIGPAPVADPVRIALHFHDVKKDDLLEKNWFLDPQPTMRFGVVMLRNNQEIGQGINVKRLTFDPWGRTNNTCLRFDGTDERLFGSKSGRWEESEIKNWSDGDGPAHDGVKSVWICDDRKIEVTQMIERVAGDQSQLIDTCRVRYRIENKDEKPHQVGIRFLLDSFIGGNDGVPFTIPGESDLCDTMKDLPKEAKDGKLPDFLQALEKPDLAHPGTIAHLRLRLEGVEAPVRVTLGAWPNEKLRVLVKKNADGPLTGWDVPVLPIKSLDLNDSAITIYWKEEPLKPGQTREVGFEYGLWTLASQGNRLAATVDGSFRPRGELTVVAYVNKAGQENVDETVTLTVPPGFKLLEGAAEQPVPRPAKDARSSNVPVTWKIQAGSLGKYDITVKSSAGPSQTIPVEIKKGILD